MQHTAESLARKYLEQVARVASPLASGPAVTWRQGHESTAGVGADTTRSTLTAAYETCRLMTRYHAHAFYFSIRFLPPEKRRAIWAIYAVCRYSDDLVDRAPDTAAPADLLARIDWWEGRLRAMDTALPIIRAFADTQARFGIPTRPLWDLLEGMRMDLTHARYATWEELGRYCYCAASTVGLLCTPVLGYDGAAETLEYAANLGIAMQLTNILRDVGADAALGRVYLPQDELAAFGYDEEKIANGIVDDAFRRLMAFQIARARTLYRSSAPGIGRLDRTGQLPVQAAATLYGGILDRIEAIDYHVYTHRAALTRWDKIARLPVIWWQARSLARA